MSWETIWHLHAGIELPDLAVIVSADPQVLAARLASRSQARSRFERQPGSSVTEHALYRDTAARLTGMGWEICEIDSTTSAPDQIADIVTDRVLALLAERERSC